jgi:hypothetical protein
MKGMELETEHVETCYQQDLPKPGPEHDWLQQLVGDWETDMECCMEPGKPPMKSKGAESVRPIGGFWIIAEGEGTVMDMHMASVLTLGYARPHLIPCRLPPPAPRANPTLRSE